MAERVGFEPTGPGGPTTFKAVAFVHSATAPCTTFPQPHRAMPRRGRTIRAPLVTDSLGWRPSVLRGRGSVGVGLWNFVRTTARPRRRAGNGAGDA